MNDPLNLEIGGMNFTIRSEHDRLLHEPDPAYTSFLRTERDPFATNVDVSLIRNTIPDTEKLNKVFESGASWSIFLQGNDYLLALRPPVHDTKPVWVARFGKDLSNITIYCGETLLPRRNEGFTLFNPVRYPLDQLLLMYLLSQREGAILHAAGIAFDAKGYAFLGRSGAGKSTLAKQFTDVPHNEVLSDDRVVVRKSGNDFQMFGTPWPGEAGFAKNKSALLAGLLFLSHSDHNKVFPLSRSEAIGRLLPVVSVPWYDQEITANILSFCDTLISTVPAYEFSFMPDRNVIGFLTDFMEHQ